MKKSLPIIAVAVLAVCIVAIVATLAIKSGNQPDIEADISNTVGYYDNNYDYYPEETTTSPFQAIVNTTAQILTDTYVPSTVATTKTPEKTTQKVTKPQTTVPPTQAQEEEVTVPQLEGVATKPVQSSGSLPQDMTFAGLSKIIFIGYFIIAFVNFEKCVLMLV